MRIGVLPRDDAARVITQATANGAWAINAANLALTIPLLFEVMLSRGLGSAIPLPLAVLVVMLGLSIAAGLRPRRWLVTTFLAVGAVGAVVFQLALVGADPSLFDEAYFLVNRPAVSLVLVAVGATTWFSGVLWVLIGFLVSTIASLAVAVIGDLPVRTGWGPLIMFVFYVVVYAVLARIQAIQRQRVPNFEQFEEDTRRLSVEENLRERVTAAVHDTLLNDLAIVMSSPDTLDERVVARLRDDLSTLRGAEWLRTSADVAAVDDVDADLRNQVMMVVSEMQWRGLTVQVTGSGPAVRHLTTDGSQAIVDATRACLENVLRHSGETRAEIDISYGPEDVTVIVADQGVGFDQHGIPDDRLGLRHSVISRIEKAGGSVKVWSSPGAGTSIVMRVPAHLVVAGGDHGDA